MFLHLISFTGILFLLIVQKTLPVKSAANCESATLRTKPSLINDCDFVNDKLKIYVFSITEPRYRNCVRKIHLWASEPHINKNIEVGGQAQVTISNPLDGANRCVQVRISVTVTFGSYHDSFFDKKFETVVRPVDKKCFEVATTALRPITNWVSVDLAESIPKKHWETCIYSVTHGSTTHRQPEKPLIVKFEAEKCKTTVATVIYSFRGQTATTIQERFSILSDVRYLGPSSQAIQDCDILEYHFNIAINKIITRPESSWKGCRKH